MLHCCHFSKEKPLKSYLVFVIDLMHIFKTLIFLFFWYFMSEDDVQGLHTSLSWESISDIKQENYSQVHSNIISFIYSLLYRKSRCFTLRY